MFEDRLNKRKKVKEEVSKILSEEDKVYFIHYSCESFFDLPDGQSPRITSIAVKHKKTGQVKSFSMHMIAEIRNIKPNKITNDIYKDIEKEMLDSYFKFIDEKSYCYWVHWNMRNINYGFSALEHRYRVLGGEPKVINDDNKIDLSRLLYNFYGSGYIENPNFESLMNLNDMSSQNFLPGKKEAEAFEEGKYVELHRSTLRKVETLNNFLDRFTAKKLKTNANMKDEYGLELVSILEFMKSKWWGRATLTVSGLVMGQVFLKIIKLS